MYVPAHFAADPATLPDLLDRAGIAHLVTVAADGLRATPLPLLFVPGGDGAASLQGHVARNNDHWQVADGAASLAIVTGPDAYVSPSWYPSKQEHGRVVPTWNYRTIHVHGRLVVHDDPEWVGDLVRRLTERFEQHQAQPWSVDDAPPKFVAGQLRAIVGVEVLIDRIEAKDKLSQNRPPADVDGVLAAYDAGAPREQAVAEAMRAARAD